MSSGGSQKILSWLPRIWRFIINKAPEWILFTVFLTLLVISIALPYYRNEFASTQYSPALSAAQSIGTGGLTSLVFYYVVMARMERKRRDILREGLKSTYSEAKRNIALAVIHASQKGGRKDLQSNFDTVDHIMTVKGFREFFDSGEQGDEGFYAFQNQMSDLTPEYDEIIFNLKIISRALERVVDSQRVDDAQTYRLFIRVSAFIARIERNGAGYDESKPLCSLIWQMFAGWSGIEGEIGYDRIERAIARL